jgi:hypothetical protein
MLTIVKKNDSYDAITYQLENEDNSTVDLTGASVNFVMGKKNKLITNAKATVTSATSGIVSYQLTPSDTLVSGTFLAEFVVTFANGTTKTYPSNGYITVDVEQNLDTSQNNVVLDMIATKQGDFEAKLDSILKQGTGTQVSAMNEYTWTATSGQTIFVFPTNAKYDPSAKWFQVSVGNVPIANELINRASSSQFSLVVDPSLIVAGMTVHAMWVEPIVPITGGHHSTHEINGQDEINIANLRNYQELVATPLADKASKADLQKRGIDVTQPPAPLTSVKLDGVTDDGPAIQAIMSYCIQNGRSVYFPNGVANIATGIVIDGVQATSDGALGTKATKFSIKTESKFGTKLIAANSSVNIFTLKNMSVDISGLWFKNGNIQLELDNLSESHFSDITFNGGLIGTQFGLGTFDNLFERCYWITFPDPSSVMINMPAVSGDSINNTTFISCHMETCGGTMVKMRGDTTSTAGRHSFIVFYNTHFETRYYSGKIIDASFIYSVSFEDCNFIVNNQFLNEASSLMVSKIIIDQSIKTMFDNCSLTYPNLTTVPIAKPFKISACYEFTVENSVIFIPQTVYPTMISCIDYSGQTNLAAINWSRNRCNTLETSSTSKDVRLTDHFLETSNRQYILKPTTTSGSTFPILDFLKSSDGGQTESKFFGIDNKGGLLGGFNQIITNGTSVSFGTATTENLNSRGIYFIQANAPGQTFAIVWHNGSSLTGAVLGTDCVVGNTDPGTAGKFNIFLNSGSLCIFNRYGSDRMVNIVHQSFRG